MTKDQSTVALNGSEKYDPLYNYPLFYVATCKDPKLVWSSKKQYLEINQSPNWKVFYNFLAYESGKKREGKKRRGKGGGREGGRKENRLTLYSCLSTYSVAHAVFCIFASSPATSLLLQILYSVVP